MSIITSTAEINRTIDETFGSDTPAPAAGSWRNTEWSNAAAWLEWGRRVGKLGIDFPTIAYKFRNMAPAIPPGATIVDAVLRGTSVHNSGVDTFISLILVCAKDGWWDPATSPTQWRSTSDWLKADAGMQVYSTGVVLLADTLVPGITIRWELRGNVAGRGMQLGQGAVITAAANLGFVDMHLSRTAAVPAGNIWCEIYAMNIFTKLPTGPMLAISNVAAAGTVGTALSGLPPFRFTFSGGNQIPLAANQQIVCVLNGDYPVGAARVSWHWDDRTRYPPAHFLVYGTGTSMDDQNYPMRQDFQSIPNSGSLFTGWTTPQMFNGVEYDTPDIGPSVNQYINGGSYNLGDPICVTLNRSTAFLPTTDVSRRWAQFGHASYPATRLIVRWKERAVRVSA
jgi:hypothetical protein